MTASNPKLIDLAARLRNGTLQRLHADELDVVLGWITRAERPSVVELETLLGVPDDDPMLFRQVFEQLDVLFFSDGDLNEAAASVTTSVAEAQRRARYRRLMAAFHPDRYPDLAQWLTPRSQAIHRAYTRFRRGESGALARTEPVAAAYPGQHVPKPPLKRSFPNIRFGPGLLALLRSRLRGVRHLEAKILAILATIFFFPVLILSLSPQPVPVSNGGAPPANPDPVAESERTSIPEGMSDSETLSLRNLGERLSRGPLADDDSVHMIDSSASPLMLLTSRELRDSAIEALSAKADAERVAAREAIARLVAARERAAMETSANQAIPQGGLASESDARPSSKSESGIPELGLGSPEQAPARSSGAGQASASDPGPSIRWESSPSVVREESGQLGNMEDGVGRTGHLIDIDPGHAVRQGLPAATDTAPKSARSDAGKTIASIEDAARRAEIREQTALSAALRETAVLDAAIRESAALEEAARLAAARQAAVREAAERETAALKEAARRAAERQSAALETAFRETVALEMVLRESEELWRATHRAADGQVETRAPETANPAGVTPGAPQRRIDASEGRTRAGSPRAVGEGQGEMPDPRSLQLVADRSATRGAGVAAEPAALDTSVESVAVFIDSYRSAFESGDIAALLEHLGPSPRENENHGRHWFEASYKSLFADSSSRQIRIRVSDVVPVAGKGWQIHAHYDLRIDYRGQAPLRAHGPVRYRVGWHAGGWRIDSIQY